MRVYAFIGKTGTGKSHNSILVAKENKIEYIIDDGLLISDNKIIAGKSAKREPTKVASVKRAIFFSDAHADNVKRAMEKEGAESVLIIGTSEKMVNKIVERLGLPHVEKIIRIEDVSTPEKMKIAHDIRMNEGKHVIPVPTFEVKKQFSGYFIDPLFVRFKKKGEKTVFEEKTVMRPTYSYLGEYKIAPKVIFDICSYESKKISEVARIFRVKSTTLSKGFINIDIDVAFYYPCDIQNTTSDLIKLIIDSVEYTTSIIVSNVNVTVKTLYVED